MAVGDQRGGAVQPDRGGGPRRVLGAGQPPPRHLAAARLRLRLPLRRRHLHQDARGCVHCRYLWLVVSIHVFPGYLEQGLLVKKPHLLRQNYFRSRYFLINVIRYYLLSEDIPRDWTKNRFLAASICNFAVAKSFKANCVKELTILHFFHNIHLPVCVTLCVEHYCGGWCLFTLYCFQHPTHRPRLLLVKRVSLCQVLETFLPSLCQNK